MSAPGVSISGFSTAIKQQPHGIDSAEENPLAQQHEHADEVRDKSEMALYEDINDVRLAKIAAKSILEASSPVSLDFESTGDFGSSEQSPLEKSQDPAHFNKLASILVGKNLI